MSEGLHREQRDCVEWTLGKAERLDEAIQRKQKKRGDLCEYRHMETRGRAESEDQGNTCWISSFHRVKQTAPITHRFVQTRHGLQTLCCQNPYCRYCLWALGIRTNLSACNLSSTEHKQRTMKHILLRKADFSCWGKGLWSGVAWCISDLHLCIIQFNPKTKLQIIVMSGNVRFKVFFLQRSRKWQNLSTSAAVFPPEGFSFVPIKWYFTLIAWIKQEKL